ncbi:MAG: type VI secretion system contractile sheath small subunit [Mariniphaga sp.]|nr:type VI secretion system contractile sheath small subunit [Mariniphaga sp.]
MARKTVYRKVIDIDVGEDVVILPDNRTLLVEQLTNKAPKQPEIKDFRNIDEVFEHYQPESVIAFENENGVPQNETLKFNNLNDFGPEGIAKQSEFLKGINNKKEVYEKFIEIVKKNSTLRNALSDPKAKEQVLKGLHAMFVELDNSVK